MTTLQLTGISKTYGLTPVLDGVDLTLHGGRIHALVGENGAGKSTLMRIVAGLTKPSRGTMTLDEAPYAPGGPRDALGAGIALISQEISLVPRLTVTENVFLGRWHNRLGWRTPAADRRRYARLLRRTGFELTGSRPVGTLSLAQQQQVEILRALARDARIVVMDEPTALLSHEESKRLLALMRSLADGGQAVVFISHFLDEVLDHCDEVTVLRDGARVGGGPVDRFDEDSLVRAMVGRSVSLLYPEPAPIPADAPVLLDVEGLSGERVRAIDLRVRAGEIVGLFGLVGAGRSETLQAIFGADPAHWRRFELLGRTITAAAPHRSLTARLGLVPESRKDQGLLLGRSVRENLALASLTRRQRAGWIDRRSERADSRRAMTAVDVRAASPEMPVWALSGGNQQKTLFGKWLLSEPRVLLVDEPTRGVDVAAKIGIHQLIVSQARAGLGVVMVSSEIEEVLGLSHTIHVMRGGSIVATFERGVDRETVLAAALGSGRPRPAPEQHEGGSQ